MTSKPAVVASNSVLCDFTKQIAQETIDLKCLIPGGKDAHTYSPTPNDRKAIETGSLILYGGYDFEPEVTKLIKAANSKTAIAVHEVAVPKPTMAVEEHDHADEKKEVKSKETQPKLKADPHVWHNVKNGIAIVQVLKTQLVQASPANAVLYEKNAKNLTDRLTKLDTWVTQSVATIPAAAKKLVTTHDALSYYGQAYGIPIEGALQGISTTEKPSAQRIATLVATIKSTQVPTLFAEVSVNPKLIETVAKESGVKLSAMPLVTDGLGEPGGPSDTYEKMIRENTTAIVTGLGGKVAS
jgi:manganese/iron transport system substrate-binding protein